MILVPEVDIRRDPRFSLEEQWLNDVVPCIEEAAQRGLVVVALTVFHPRDGNIEGWLMHGWEPPPGKLLWPNPPCEDKL